jgi:hypothetical protein
VDLSLGTRARSPSAGIAHRRCSARWRSWPPCGDRPAGPRVDFAVTHTDLLEQEGSSPLDLPPEPAVVEGGAAAVNAHGVIATPDACDDLGAQLEPSDSLLTFRVIVRGSRTHPGECSDLRKFALVQWRASIHRVHSGTRRVRVLYDYCGLRPHPQGGTGRDPYPDRGYGPGGRGPLRKGRQLGDELCPAS